MHLAHGKLDVVRIQHAQPIVLVFQRQHFRFELDAVVADQLWPHVQVSGFLHVRVAELENNLRSAPSGTSAFVQHAATTPSNHNFHAVWSAFAGASKSSLRW